ncbi:MAG: hypothetical protein BGO67_10900 [Alphaproteobacteria bacterium 41-28]|nr:MAG: hypothetical protein BGO67_10900 [Alphaproteobacteria bacterium 41-28]
MNIRKFLFFTLVTGINLLAYPLSSLAMEAEAEEEEKTSLRHLPYELHGLIVGDCGARELGTLASVSKYWKTVAEKDEFWRRIAVDEGIFDSEDVQEKKGLKALVKKDVTSPIVIQVKNATRFPLRVKPQFIVIHDSSVEAINEWKNKAVQDRFPSTVGETSIQLPKRSLEVGKYIIIRQWEIEERTLPQLKKEKEFDEIARSIPSSSADNDSLHYVPIFTNLNVKKSGGQFNPLRVHLQPDIKNKYKITSTPYFPFEIESDE